MWAGRLRHRVTIKRRDWVENSMGERKQVWVDHATVWASIEPLRGQEFQIAQQQEAAVTTRIRIRYRGDIVPSMLVSYQGITFEILHVIHPNFDRRELQLMCREWQVE